MLDDGCHGGRWRGHILRRRGCLGRTRAGEEQLRVDRDRNCEGHGIEQLVAALPTELVAAVANALLVYEIDGRDEHPLATGHRRKHGALGPWEESVVSNARCDRPSEAIFVGA